jgi:hypothetical protein
MLERFFRRKPKIIKAASAYLPELNDYFVSKKILWKLGKHAQLIETPGNFIFEKINNLSASSLG